MQQQPDLDAIIQKYGGTFAPPPTPAAQGVDLDAIIRKYGGTTTPSKARKSAAFKGLVEHYATQAGLDPELVYRVIDAESNGNPKAVSPKKAKGLMQLMDATAAEYAVSDPFDPEQNIRAGTSYLKKLLDQYGGDEAKALAAYNAGPTAVNKHNGVPPYPETQAYVAKITAGRGGQQAPPAPTPAGSDLDIVSYTPDDAPAEAAPSGPIQPRAQGVTDQTPRIGPQTTLGKIKEGVGDFVQNFPPLRMIQGAANAVKTAGDEVVSGLPQMARGIAQLAPAGSAIPGMNTVIRPSQTPEQYAKGLNDLAEGSMKVGAPLIIPALASNPLFTAAMITAATVASDQAVAFAKRAGWGEEYQRLAGNAAALTVLGIGGKRLTGAALRGVESMARDVGVKIGQRIKQAPPEAARGLEPPTMEAEVVAGGRGPQRPPEAPTGEPAGQAEIAGYPAPVPPEARPIPVTAEEGNWPPRQEPVSPDPPPHVTEAAEKLRAIANDLEPTRPDLAEGVRKNADDLAPPVAPVQPEPPAPEVPKSAATILPAPNGWSLAVGRTRTKEGHPFEAEVDWRNKRIVFAEQRHLDNPSIRNHEIAHVIIETLPEAENDALLSKYAEIKRDSAKWQEYGPEWIVKNKFHHEEIAVDATEYLEDPSSVSPELRELFDGVFGAKPAPPASSSPAQAEDVVRPPSESAPEPVAPAPVAETPVQPPAAPEIPGAQALRIKKRLAQTKAEREAVSLDALLTALPPSEEPGVGGPLEDLLGNVGVELSEDGRTLLWDAGTYRNDFNRSYNSQKLKPITVAKLQQLLEADRQAGNTDPNLATALAALESAKAAPKAPPPGASVNAPPAPVAPSAPPPPAPVTPEPPTPDAPAAPPALPNGWFVSDGERPYQGESGTWKINVDQGRGGREGVYDYETGQVEANRSIFSGFSSSAPVSTAERLRLAGHEVVPLIPEGQIRSSVPDPTLDERLAMRRKLADEMAREGKLSPDLQRGPTRNIATLPAPASSSPAQAENVIRPPSEIAPEPVAPVEAPPPAPVEAAPVAPPSAAEVAKAGFEARKAARSPKVLSVEQADNVEGVNVLLSDYADMVETGRSTLSGPGEWAGVLQEMGADDPTLWRAWVAEATPERIRLLREMALDARDRVEDFDVDPTREIDTILARLKRMEIEEQGQGDIFGEPQEPAPVRPGERQPISIPAMPERPSGDLTEAILDTHDSALDQYINKLHDVQDDAERRPHTPDALKDAIEAAIDKAVAEQTWAEGARRKVWAEEREREAAARKPDPPPPSVITPSEPASIAGLVAKKEAEVRDGTAAAPVETPTASTLPAIPDIPWQGPKPGTPVYTMLETRYAELSAKDERLRGQEVEVDGKIRKTGSGTKIRASLEARLKRIQNEREDFAKEYEALRKARYDANLQVALANPETPPEVRLAVAETIRGRRKQPSLNAYEALKAEAERRLVEMGASSDDAQTEAIRIAGRLLDSPLYEGSWFDKSIENSKQLIAERRGLQADLDAYAALEEKYGTFKGYMDYRKQLTNAMPGQRKRVLEEAEEQLKAEKARVDKQMAESEEAAKIENDAAWNDAQVWAAKGQLFYRRVGDGEKSEWIPSKGKLIEIPEVPGYRFWLSRQSGSWILTEETTGQSVYSDPDKATAIQDGIARIIKNKGHIEQAIAKGLEGAPPMPALRNYEKPGKRKKAPKAAKATAPVTPAPDALIIETPEEAAAIVAEEVKHVIDTQGLADAKAVQQKVLDTLASELPGADRFREARGFLERARGQRITEARAAAEASLEGGRARTLEDWKRIREAEESAGPMPPSVDTITIEIPGDGTFTINRNPDAIRTVMKRISAQGPKAWKDMTAKALSERGQAMSASADVRRASREEFDRAAEYYKTREDEFLSVAKAGDTPAFLAYLRRYGKDAEAAGKRLDNPATASDEELSSVWRAWVRPELPPPSRPASPSKAEAARDAFTDRKKGRRK